ncbi:MAG TPA: hypothetical protein VG345_06285 [Bryobacteraceae bacterium]|nr:hypothetical protein [Bryobacteraceae bacterium]
MRRVRVGALALGCGALAIAGLSSSYMVPLDNDAIQYMKAPVNDPVSKLQARVDSGQAKLKFDDDFGYLRSVLTELGLSTKTQLLVFSKTSFQAPRIGPRTPRALYFGDNVAVGFVRTGDVLEFASIDPKQGVVFYTLDQEPSSKPQFQRQDSCLQCHQSSATYGAPGLVVRSIFPDHTGTPILSAGGYITDHRSAIKDRWGGWYVTGTTGNQNHMGNATVEDPSNPSRLVGFEGENSQNVTSLKWFIDTEAYLSPHSDVVALMTLEHETQMVNLMTRVGWEARMATAESTAISKSLGEPTEQLRDSAKHRIDSAVEELVEYMLFVDETKLTAPIQGTSGFAEEFAKRGPTDGQGRSLRQFDMKTRMFRYPLSFMIYSDAFDGMPDAVKERVYRRLYDILSGKDTNPKFAGLSPADRKAIIEIVAATKKGLPDYWRG